jgi:hypothetical protein
MEVTGLHHTLASLPPTIWRKTGGLQHWSGCFEKEIKLLPLSEFKPWIFKVAP